MSGASVTSLAGKWALVTGSSRGIGQQIALVAMCNALAPPMVERGYGRIVNLTSGIRDTPALLPDFGTSGKRFSAQSREWSD